MTQGLFGLAPEELQAAQEQDLRKQAAVYSQMAPMEAAQFGFYQAGNRLGGAAGSLMGAQDPMLAKASALKALMQQNDISTAEGMAKFAQAAAKIDPQVAYTAAQKAQEMAQEQAVTKNKQLTAAREEQLRQELAALGPDATQEQVLAVVTKYGSADKILTTLQGSADKKELQREKIEARKEELEAKLKADLELARERGANQLQLAQMQIEGRKQIASLVAALKPAKEEKPNVLKPLLQKEEGEDLAKVDAHDLTIRSVQAPIADLTPDPKTGKAKLELGPVQNLKYQAKLASGNSDEQARAYGRLKEAVDQAVNIQVSAEKGVQTDGDVLRFSKALIAAFGRNDTKATKEALERLMSAQEAARDKTKKRIDNRRKAQKVEAYYGNIDTEAPVAPAAVPGTAANPIKLN